MLSINMLQINNSVFSVGQILIQASLSTAITLLGLHFLFKTDYPILGGICAFLGIIMMMISINKVHQQTLAMSLSILTFTFLPILMMKYIGSMYMW